MTIRRIVFIISVSLIFIVGYLHNFFGTEISLMLFYAVPVLLSAWFCGKTEGILIALFATLMWLAAGFQHSDSVEKATTLTWNAFTRFGIFALVAYTVALQAKLRAALERERLRADSDRLTGLLNKSAFRERVEEEIRRAKRYRHPLSIAFIDLDNFKVVNDEEGHARGDMLLQHVSRTIVGTIRKTDIAGRVGGDEFSICFPETGETAARKAIEKLAIAMDIMTSQSSWRVTASIGVVTCADVSETYDELLGEADKLMYVAKGKGKNAAEFKSM